MKSNPRLTLALGALVLAHCHRTPPSAPPSPGATTPPTVTQGTPPPSAAAANPASTPPPLDPPAPATEFRDGAQWLPQGNLAGWQQSGTVTRSDAENLFQIMDGAAPSYARYGLHAFAKTEYRRAGTWRVASVEIYEFRDALGAFGRYAAMLSDGRDPASLEHQGVAVGSGGYQGSTQIAFWKGRFLVQINVQDTSDEPDEAGLTAAAREALPQIAAAVGHGLNDTTTPPASPLPTSELVWGGATYTPDEVFGVAHSGPGWIGFYRAADGKRYRLAVLDRTTPADAGQTLHAFHVAGATAVPGVGDEAFTITLPGVPHALVARRGNSIYVVADGGVPDTQSPDAAGQAALMTALLQRPAH